MYTFWIEPSQKVGENSLKPGTLPLTRSTVIPSWIVSTSQSGRRKLLTLCRNQVTWYIGNHVEHYAQINNPKSINSKVSSPSAFDSSIPLLLAWGGIRCLRCAESNRVEYASEIKSKTSTKSKRNPETPLNWKLFTRVIDFCRYQKQFLKQYTEFGPSLGRIHL